MSCSDAPEGKRDLDCPGSLVCYSGDLSWRNESDGGLCECSAWWGHIGKECSAPGPTTLCLVASASIVAGLALLALMYNIKTVYNIIDLEHTKKWNSANATLAFTTLAVLGIMGWRATTILIIMTPEKADTDFLKTLPNEKVHDWVPVEKVFVGISVMFTTLSTITIVIAWIDLVNKSKKMIRSSQAGAFADRTKSVIAFGCAFVLCIMIASALGSMEAAIFFSIPFFTIIIIAYIYAFYMMGKLVQLMEKPESSSDADRKESFDAPPGSPTVRDAKQRGSVRRAMSTFSTALNMTSSGSSEKLKRKKKKSKYIGLLNKVRRTSILVVMALTMLMVCTGVYAFPSLKTFPKFESSWRELCQPGQLCIYSLLFDVSSIFLLAATASVQYFIYKNFTTQFKRVRRARSHSNVGGASSSGPIGGGSSSAHVTASTAQVGTVTPLQPLDTAEDVDVESASL